MIPGLIPFVLSLSIMKVRHAIDLLLNLRFVPLCVSGSHSNHWSTTLQACNFSVRP